MRTTQSIFLASLLVLGACDGGVSSNDENDDGSAPKDSRADGSVDVVDPNDKAPNDGGGVTKDAGRDAGMSASGTDAGMSARDAGTSTNPSSTWRPFNDQSPWNTLIGDNPALAPDSTTLIADLKNSSQYGQNLDINIAQFSIPLFYAQPGAATTDVVCDLGGLGFTGKDGANAHAQVPIPAGAAPDPESDHHLLIVDRAKNIEWGMWNTVNDKGRWTCGLGATMDLTGDGLRPFKPNNPTWYTSHGPRACGFALIAGLIRTEEIDAGKIEHALVIAYPHIRAGFYMSPASTAQTRIGDDSIKTRGIPCGGHIQLDPKLDLDSLKLTRAGRIVAEALQRYGAFVGDYSGAISLYAENSPAAQAHWKGLLDTYEFSNKLDLSKFRALAFGKLTDDGNGD
jgi:hypothetical protein